MNTQQAEVLILQVEIAAALLDLVKAAKHLSVTAA